MRLKNLFIILALTFSNFSHSKSGGVIGGGGGDICEKKIQDISNDIKKWILLGGYLGLKLPSSLNHSDYKNQMNEVIDNFSIQCVSKGDREFPISVYDNSKICKYIYTEEKKEIFCDLEKFLKRTEEDKYILIHHELAGLAHIENPKKEKSNYDFSDQISLYLEDVTVKKLSLKRRDSNTRDNKTEVFRISHVEKLLFDEGEKQCESINFESLKTNAIRSCVEKGYKVEECRFSFDKIEYKKINEKSFLKDKNLTYKSECRFSVLIEAKKVKQSIGKYEIITAIGDMKAVSAEYIFKYLNQNTNLDYDVFSVNRLVLNNYKSGQEKLFIFKLNVNENALNKTITIDKTCIPQKYADFLRETNNLISNEYFRLTLNVSREQRFLDFCPENFYSISGQVDFFNNTH